MSFRKVCSVYTIAIKWKSLIMKIYVVIVHLREEFNIGVGSKFSWCLYSLIWFASIYFIYNFRSSCINNWQIFSCNHSYILLTFHMYIYDHLSYSSIFTTFFFKATEWGLAVVIFLALMLLLFFSLGIYGQKFRWKVLCYYWQLESKIPTFSSCKWRNS